MPDAVPPTLVVHRTDIDGVRTLWIDEPGPLVATLIFRVGRSDEPTPLGGITHIAEHLALAGLGVQDYDHNGFVDGQMTAFTSVGRPDEIRSFMEQVAGGLSQPPLDRLLLERRILRAEREQRGPSIGGAVRWCRYGYAGQGRGLGPFDDEIGLDWLGPEPVEAWIRRWFVRQNAVLWLSGPPPEGLRVRLPDGDPAPLPSSTPIPGISFPAHLPWDGPAATLGYTAPRSPGVTISANIAHRRARQQLRFDSGLVYDVQFDYEPVDPTTAHVLLGAECADDRIKEVAEGLLGVVRAIAAEGPTTAELAQEMDATIRHYEDRDGRIGYLAARSMDTLWGAPERTIEQIFEDRRAVGTGEAAAAMREGLESLLVLAKCEPLSDLAPYPVSSADRIAGRDHVPSGFHLPGLRPKDRMTIGPDGVTVLVGPSEWLTIRFTDAVACIHSSPNVRVLLASDGIRIAVDGGAWKDGARIIEELDRTIPPELVACDEHGVGGLEDPAQDAPAA